MHTASTDIANYRAVLQLPLARCLISVVGCTVTVGPSVW